MDLQRKGLGRGIASLIPVRQEMVPAVSDRESNTASKGFLFVPIENIVPNPYQPRKFFDEEKIEELADSIREKGVLQPLIVTRQENHYEIISGERRFRAAKLIGLTEIPVIVRDAEPKEVLELAIIENVQREDLDPIEEASAYQELIEQFGYTQEDVALKIGKDRATISNTLRLIKLPAKIKELLQSGRLSEGHARALLGMPEIEKQIYFAERVVEEGWSVRELESRIKSKRVLGLKKGIRQSLSLPPALIYILDELRRKLGTQVKIIPSGNRGKILIEYYSELDLDRIYHTLTK